MKIETQIAGLEPYIQASSPKKIAKRLRALGYVGDLDLGMAALARAREDRAERDAKNRAAALAAYNPNPRMVDANARARAACAAITASPTAPLWRKNLRAAVADAATLNLTEQAADAAGRAILDLVAREARRRGWVIRAASTGRDGRIGSYYIRVPGLGEARVSDHDLPQTMARQIRASNGQAGGWDGEVITPGLVNEPLTRIMRRVLLAAGGR